MSSVFFSSQLDRFVITSHFNSIKTALNAYFLQKVDFCIFEPRNKELIENSFKAPLNCSPLKCIYLGISLARSQSGHLELRFSVVMDVVFVWFVCLIVP